MALQIRRATAENLKIKLLLFGQPGTGKTYLAATANDHPALAPALFLNFEGGLLSVVGRGDIDAIDIRTIDELEEAYNALRKRDSQFVKYKTVIIDSASELYNKSLGEAAETRKKGGSVDTIMRDDYGKASYQTHRLFRAFRDLPMNVIATSHARFAYSQIEGAMQGQPINVTPAFPDKLATQMLGIFDFAWYQYLFDEETKDENGVVVGVAQKRALLTQETGAYRAKTRGREFPKILGSVVEEPYLPTIYDLLLESEKPGFVAPTEDRSVTDEQLDQMAEQMSEAIVQVAEEQGESPQVIAELVADALETETVVETQDVMGQKLLTVKREPIPAEPEPRSEVTDFPSVRVAMPVAQKTPARLAVKKG